MSYSDRSSVGAAGGVGGVLIIILLIGLRVGQGMALLDSEDVLGTVTVLAVQDPADLCSSLND